jgi:hypothetical protein
MRNSAIRAADYDEAANLVRDLPDLNSINRAHLQALLRAAATPKAAAVDDLPHCQRCEALCPYDGRPCPNCGSMERKRFWIEADVRAAAVRTTGEHCRDMGHVGNNATCDFCGAVKAAAVESAEGANAAILEHFAKNYASMARDGDGKINCGDVAIDIRQNMIPQLVEATPPAAAPVEPGAKHWMEAITRIFGLKQAALRCEREARELAAKDHTRG